jgi:hypothetical protein
VTLKDAISIVPKFSALLPSSPTSSRIWTSQFQSNSASDIFRRQTLMAPIDYSKWDNIDTDSEPEVSGPEKNVTQASAPSESISPQVIVRSNSPTIPSDEWSKWENIDTDSESEMSEPAQNSTQPPAPTPSGPPQAIVPGNPSTAPVYSLRGDNVGTNPKPETSGPNRNPTEAATPSGSRLSQTPNMAFFPVPAGQLNILSSAPTLDDPKTVLGVRKPALCGVCCNLDPRQAPREPDPTTSWATEEFNIPPETPSGKITIQKSEHLLESAKLGCFYCSVVQNVLGQFHPGWEKEESFIYIYVALGLPVVVRLQFGQLATSTLEREGISEMGIVLPEGETMAQSMEIIFADKGVLEVEIYRPRLTPDQMSRGGKFHPIYSKISTYRSC